MKKQLQVNDLLEIFVTLSSRRDVKIIEEYSEKIEADGTSRMISILCIEYGSLKELKQMADPE